jgi:hypothetical protein
VPTLSFFPYHSLSESKTDPDSRLMGELCWYLKQFINYCRATFPAIETAIHPRLAPDSFD